MSAKDTTDVTTMVVDLNLGATTEDLVKGFRGGSSSIESAAACASQLHYAQRAINGLDSVKLTRIIKLRSFTLNLAKGDTSITDCAKYLTGDALNGKKPPGISYDPVSALELFALASKLEALLSDKSQSQLLPELTALTGVVVGYKPIKLNPVCVFTQWAGTDVMVTTHEYPVLIIDQGVPRRITTVLGSSPIKILGLKVIGAVSYACKPSWIYRNRDGVLIRKGIIHG